MGNENELTCSFCGRVKPETQILVAGLDAHICEKCISQANKIVEEESTKVDTSEFSIELKLPKVIKAFLDEYVIGQNHAKIVLSVAVYKAQRIGCS